MSSSGETLSVGEFFNRVSGQYDASIRRTIPPYQEMFEATLGYCFLDTQAPLKILELGCGTGNLSLYVGDTFPNAHLTLVDLSPDMLAQAGAKLAHLPQQPSLLEGGFMDVQQPWNHFDLVVSSVALHHLTDTEKPSMYRRVFDWLRPGGLFRCADEVLTLPADLAMPKNEARWKEWAGENGATDEELAMWMDHAEKYDHYSCLHEHFRWLGTAGFVEIDCYWKRLYWAVYGARKPG